MIDVTSLTTESIKKSLLNHEYSALDLVNAYLDRINKFDPKIKAFITVTQDLALDTAKKIDQKIASNLPLGKLAGSVMAVKDIYLTAGIQTTSGSKVLSGYIPQYSSTVYQKLLNEDVILIGKTNTDTFAFGASTENSGFFTTHNPWNLDLVPGGSSGGSAAAIAASMCTFSLGTDTGGSIRQPASLCGVTGIKPTYGRNSRYGITAMASSFDSPGVFARTVKDLAVITEIMAGKDDFDATTSTTTVPPYSTLLDKPYLKGLKIGLPKEYFSDGMDQDVKKTVLAAVEFFKTNGSQIIDISLPNTKLGIAVYYILVPSEISSNMARYDGIRFGQSYQNSTDLFEYYTQTRGEYMEPELKRRILIGTYALSSGYYDAYYTKASKVRTLIKEEFQDAFQQVDLILTPTSPTPAWPIGQKANDPLSMYMADVFTVCVNVAGLPAIALPCGFSSQKLPIGFQLIGNYFQEEKLFSIGHQYQELTDFHLQKPSL